MKYIIERTSDWMWVTKTQPCEEAVLENVRRVESYNLKTFEEYDNNRYNKRYNYKFLDKGVNHRVTDKGIARDFYEDKWVMEINSIEDLNKFVDKYGDIICKRSIEYPDYYSILIYDSYIE